MGVCVLTASQLKALVVAKETVTKEKEQNQKFKAGQRKHCKKALELKQIAKTAARQVKKEMREAQAAQKARDKIQQPLDKTHAVKRPHKRWVMSDATQRVLAVDDSNSCLIISFITFIMFSR